MPRSRSFLVLAVAALIACDKSTRDPATFSLDPTPVAAADPAPAARPAGKASPRGPEHPVYSLVDNRLSAHLSRGGGLLVPAGSAGFAKYVRFANVRSEERRVGKECW